MRDALRYLLVDEPRPSVLSRVALPPLLVFMAATFFLPWGYLLIAVNAVALNGPRRNREIALPLSSLALYFLALRSLDGAVRTGLLSQGAAPYLLVAAIGIGMALAAFAYVSQAHAFELRRHLQGHSR